ncbi:gmp reductase 2 [Nannochloropsis gaditana]|uniref:Gmp reductase 2 n=1 Tax=Nannochloropsis gaditana TaxID=72520 RepID=W7THM1_9STRA|nr:gmp reductase 2 [Nannochloropsis gaditana]
MFDILGGLRSTCTYVGASKLKELSKRTTFIRVTQQLNPVFGPDQKPQPAPKPSPRTNDIWLQRNGRQRPNWKKAFFNCGGNLDSVYRKREAMIRGFSARLYRFFALTIKNFNT